MKKLLQEENLFTLGGHKPLFEESSLHLGIMMSEKLDEVPKLNIEHRMKQTKKKIFMSSAPNASNNQSLPFTYLQKLHRSFYKSSMSSGLCTLNIKEKDLIEIVNFERKMIRSYFNLKKNSHIIVPYLLLGLEPIEVNIDKETMSMFYNVWKNKDNPLFKINKRILEKRMKGNFWILKVEEILKKLKLPSCLELMKRTPPPKSEWKRVIKEKVNNYHIRKWMKNLNKKKSMKNLFRGDLKMNGKVNDMISYCKTPREVTAATIAVKMLIGELPTAEYQKRIGKDSESACIYCDNNYGIKILNFFYPLPSL